MSLNLKVKIPSQGVSKIMRFSEQMSVHEACKQIQEKTNVGGMDHGLFVPSPEGDPNSAGRWLKAERTLEYYDLKTNDTVEYKKKHDVIKVKLIDDTVKSFLVDQSLPAKDIVATIGQKMSLKNFDEFALQPEQKPGIWLKDSVPLAEQVNTLEQCFLLKKKFFMNDANVDQDDPISLHLVYCQSRDDIVTGRHPVTKEEATNFAALQCQVQNGDYKPEVHKSGWLRLQDYLAPQHAKKDLEKNIYAEWKKLVGMNEVNARFRYVQACRSLKTYGMTVFKVKERVPGKKKLTNALLAFTRDSILRMEYESKRVMKEYPFKHLLRWAASPETFTMDFGAHEEDYVVVVTKEGEAISSLIAGYIDLLLKKQRDVSTIVEDDGAEQASISTVARLGGLASAAMTGGLVGGGDTSYSQSANDVGSAAKAIEKMINDLFGEVAKISDNSLSPNQRREQLESQARALGALAETIEQLAKSGNRTAMNEAAHKIAVAVESLIGAARQAAASGADPNGILMEATKGVSDALAALLAAAQNSANKPNDPDARDALARAQLAAQAALQKLAAASKGVYADDGFQQLFREMAKAVAAESQIMVNTAQAATARLQDPVKKNQMNAATGSLQGAEQNFAKISEVLAAVASDPNCKSTIEKAGRALETGANYLAQTAQSVGLDPNAMNSLSDAQKRLNEALRNLLGVTDLPHMTGAKEAEEFTEAAQAILQSTAAIMAAEGNPNLIKNQCGEVKNAATKLGVAGKGLIAAQTDAPTKERLANYLKAVVEASKNLLTSAPAAISNPNDGAANAKLQTAAAELNEATHQLIGDTGRQVAVSALYNSAKLAAATTTSLCTSSRLANASLRDNEGKAQLAEAGKAAAVAVQNLVATLRDVTHAAPEANRRSTFTRNSKRLTATDLLKDDIMQAAEKFAPVAYKLVSTSKSVSPKVENPEAKQDLVYCSSNAAKAIHKMLANRKAMKAVKGQLETAEATEEFKAAQADLESAIIACDTGILQPTMGKDEALIELANSIQQWGTACADAATTSKTAPEDLGPAMKKVAATTTRTINAGTALAAAVEDRNIQKGILYALKAATADVKQLMNVCKAVAASPEDPNLNKLLGTASDNVIAALAKLTEASKGVIPKFVENQQAKAQSDIEDLAEKELMEAASVIEGCVAKLNAATEAARQRATERGLDLEEQNITEAILEASQAIAKATAVLVHAATAVQREFQSLVKEPRTANVYKRDPQWAQGLISAARTVAATVKHLVSAANEAAQGNASEEALVVAAQAVSAATAQLVTASTVKADPNSQSQIRLREASSRVGAATAQLVIAAKTAAQWEKEKQEEEEDKKYNLTNNKIKEMEKQMEILRLEKQLEAARSTLGTMRKAEYSDAGKSLQPAPATKPAANPAANPTRAPPGQAGNRPPAQVANRGTPTGPAGPARGLTNSNGGSSRTLAAPGRAAPGNGPAPGANAGPAPGPVRVVTQPGRRGPPGRVVWNSNPAPQ